MKPRFKAPGTKRLNLKYDELLSSFAFNFNLRRYIKGFIEASSAKKCDEASDPPMSMDGFVTFACAEVEGSGSVSAVKNCGKVGRCRLTGSKRTRVESA